MIIISENNMRTKAPTKHNLLYRIYIKNEYSIKSTYIKESHDWADHQRTAQNT